MSLMPTILYMSPLYTSPGIREDRRLCKLAELLAPMVGCVRALPHLSFNMSS